MWVQKELEILVITKHVMSFASPIVVVPKHAAPGDPPRRIFVDYRAVNKLLPAVTKAHSKEKGIL